MSMLRRFWRILAWTWIAFAVLDVAAFLLSDADVAGYIVVDALIVPLSLLILRYTPKENVDD